MIHELSNQSMSSKILIFTWIPYPESVAARPALQTDIGEVETRHFVILCGINFSSLLSAVRKSKTHVVSSITNVKRVTPHYTTFHLVLQRLHRD